MSEVVIRVVVEQRPAPAPSGAAAWAPKGGRRAVTPAPKYGLGKVLYYKPASRKGKDMNETKTKIVKETRTVTRFRGLGKAARELGVSRGHLSYVLHGQRKPGKDLERKLRRMGITPGGRAV